MKSLLVLLSGDDRGSAAWCEDSASNATALPDVAYSGLPRADRTTAIVPAARMRTLVVGLPPVPPDKRLAVVRYALEDQLAGDIDTQHIVVAASREGNAVVHVLDREWLRRTAQQMRAGGTSGLRIVAESDLVPPATAPAIRWVWHDDGGFLIAPDGRVGILDRSEETLPAGLLLALQGGATGTPAREVVVHGPAVLAQSCATWSAATGVPFRLEHEWHWHDAVLPTIERVPDLLTPDLDRAPGRLAGAATVRWTRRAAGWATAALLLHVGATIADWAVQRLRVERVERDTRDAIVAAQPDTGGDLAAWHRAAAAKLHAAGRLAPDDALPLLADAAAGLADVPPGAVRVINYEAGQLTLDFDRAAGAIVSQARNPWATRGLVALSAETAAGLRARLTRE